MNRLERTKVQVKRRKSRTFIIVVLILGFIVIGGASFLLLQDRLFHANRQDGVNLIDQEQTVAMIDIFDQTYVRVYIREGETAVTVKVNGELLFYNADAGRWELILTEHKAGDKLVVVANADNGTAQEVVLTVEDIL